MSNGGGSPLYQYLSSIGAGSPAAWSNWGWRYGASPWAAGQQQATGAGQQYYGGQAQVQMPQGYQPTLGMPQNVPMDQGYMQQYLYPTLGGMEQAKARVYASGEEMARRISEGQKLTEEYGLTAPAEISPNVMRQVRVGLGQGLQSVKEQAARSGIPLSSMAERATEGLLQSAGEQMATAGASEEENRRRMLMQLIQAFMR